MNLPAFSRCAAVALLTLALMPGCSLSRVQPLRSGWRPTSAPECTTDRTPIRLDRNWAAVLGLGAAGFGAAALGVIPTKRDDREGYGYAAAGLLIPAAILGTSALVGNSRVNQCLVAQAQWDAGAEQRSKDALARAETARKAIEEKAEVAREAAEEKAEVARKEQQEQEKQAKAEADAAEQRFATARRTPLQKSSVEINNQHAEAIFRVDATLPESNETFQVVDELRVPAKSRRTFEGALPARAGQEIVVEMGAMYLGKWHFLGRAHTALKQGKTFVIIYDWDTATATFRAQTEWR